MYVTGGNAVKPLARVAWICRKNTSLSSWLADKPVADRCQLSTDITCTVWYRYQKKKNQHESRTATEGSTDRRRVTGRSTEESSGSLCAVWTRLPPEHLVPSLPLTAEGIYRASWRTTWSADRPATSPTTGWRDSSCSTGETGSRTSNETHHHPRENRAKHEAHVCGWV